MPIAPVLSVARTVKLKFPVSDGVPLTTPDAEFRPNPNGNCPEEMDQVIGAVPPVLMIGWE